MSANPAFQKSLLPRRALFATLQQQLLSPVLNIIGLTRILRDECDTEYATDLTEILKASHGLLKRANSFLENPAEMESGDSSSGGLNNVAKFRQDLLGPINIIRGYVELLLEVARARSDDRAEMDIRRIHRLTEDMLSVVSLFHEDEEGGSEQDEAAGLINPQLRLVTHALRTLERLESNAAPRTNPARVLVVDDDEQSRDLLCRNLNKEGHKLSTAENGRVALEMLRSGSFDVVLLDIIMPELNGYQVLVEMKKDKMLRIIPVIMISTLNDSDSVVRCIELGAADYLPKPFNPALLRARLAASLEKKRLRDKEQHYLEQIRIERERSERLLLDVLPNAIVERLKNGEKTIADDVDEVTVLFCDLVGFTEYSKNLSAAEVVHRLNEIFLRFDRLVEKRGLEKIKTIGDAYLVVGGLPGSNSEHAQAVANLALEMRDAVVELNNLYPEPLDFRMGMHTGPIVAGVIGRKRFTYDVWGDAVNIASRMESHGVPGKIQVSEATYKLVKNDFSLEFRGTVPIKGAGDMSTYFLTGAA